MKKVKYFLIILTILVASSVIAQDFTPYYFNNEYTSHKSTAINSFVDGDFNYKFSGRQKYDEQIFSSSSHLYSSLIHCSYTDDSLMCFVTDFYKTITIKYLDADLNVLNKYLISKSKHNKNAYNLKVIIRDDTVFYFSQFKNKAQNKYYLFCESYMLLDGTYNNDLRMIAESHFTSEDIRSIELIKSENNDYYAVLVDRQSYIQNCANKSEYFLFDRNFNIIKHQDSLLIPDSLIDKYPQMYTENYKEDSHIQFWMQKIRLNNNGDLSFICFNDNYKYCHANYNIMSNSGIKEREIPLVYCFINIPKNTINPKSEILIKADIYKYIQDVDYKFIKNDSILFSAFYITKNSTTKNILSFIASSNDSETVIKSDNELDRRLILEYVTDIEKKRILEGSEYSLLNIKKTYRSEGIFEFNDGYINIIRSCAAFGGGSNMLNVFSYLYGYYFVHYSKDGEYINTYNIPQRRLVYKGEPNMLFSIIDDNLYIIFADGRFQIKKELSTNHSMRGKNATRYTQLVIYRVDEKFNISQYLCPISHKDFDIVFLEKDLWLSDTEIIGGTMNDWGSNKKYLYIDFSEIIKKD